MYNEKVMKKILIDKGDGIAEVIDRILAVGDDDVVVGVPKGSALAKSGSNFRLLKREADEAGKTVAIDSQDEVVLAFAREHGIAVAGMAPKHAATGMSDIVSKSAVHRDEDEEDEMPVRKKVAPSVKLTVPVDEEEERSFLSSERFFKPRTVPSRAADADDDDEEEGSRGISGKAVGWTIGIIIVVIGIFYVVTTVFGRAQVTIDFTQTPWTYQANFIADQSVSSISTGSSGASSAVTVIPAQIFTSQKNVTQLFPATGGSSTVSVKAQGTLTIYNDYSSAPQDLVATTRFVTPTGQLFRLVNNVTVPGATVGAGGAITPSSINTPIIADQGGPAGNIGPVAKLTIPGFQNNPGKYAGFYGSIASGTAGGFTGIKPVPSAADIANAKTKTTAILQSDLQDGLASSYPNNFEILDGATDITISKLTISTTTDANGNFSVFGEASLTAIGFDQSALESYLLTLAQSQTQGANGAVTLAFKAPSPTLNYSDVQANFSKGQVSFSLAAQGTLEPAFSSDQFASQVAGEGIGDARAAIAALPQLSDGKISVWPIWLWSMPSSAKKIQVTVN